MDAEYIFAGNGTLPLSNTLMFGFGICSSAYT